MLSICPVSALVYQTIPTGQEWLSQQWREERIKTFPSSWALVVAPVIPATQEAETRRTMVQSQANSSRDPILKSSITKQGWWSGSRYRLWVQIPVPKKKKNPTKQRNKNLSPLNIAKYLGSYVTDTDDKTWSWKEDEGPTRDNDIVSSLSFSFHLPYL
jgi:hypothetical protein